MRQPAILGALLEEVLPASLGEEHPHPELKGKRPIDFQSSAFKAASMHWREEFHLPPTREVLGEAKATLLLWVGQPSTWRDRDDKELRWWWEHESGVPVIAFEFQPIGWQPAVETIAEAKRRLRTEFAQYLEQVSEKWDGELAWARLKSLPGFEAIYPTNARGLKWLAEKQACRTSAERLRKRERCTVDTIRDGLNSAADLIGLPRDMIRKAPAGRPRKAAASRPSKS